MDSRLLEEVKIYCQSLMDNSRCKNLPFHNWQHTKEVVQASKFIVLHENLLEETIEEIIIAAYFHDIGNVQGSAGHEDLSCKYAQDFLGKEGFPNHRIKNVLTIIKATKLPQNPKTLPQKIICDADLAHLGKKNFTLKNFKLRKEWSIYNDQEYTDEQWIEMNVNFLQNHAYHTEFAQKHYAQQKLENVDVLKEMLI